MHYGTVNVDGDAIEAWITLTVVRDSDATMDVAFLIDTGFGGELALPHSIISRLNLQPSTRDDMAITLADGSTGTADVYTAYIIWNGLLRPVDLLNLECEPLAGMELLRGCNISIDAAPGGVVAIAKLPAAS